MNQTNIGYKRRRNSQNRSRSFDQKHPKAESPSVTCPPSTPFDAAHVFTGIATGNCSISPNMMRGVWADCPQSEEEANQLEQMRVKTNAVINSFQQALDDHTSLFYTATTAGADFGPVAGTN